MKYGILYIVQDVSFHRILKRSDGDYGKRIMLRDGGPGYGLRIMKRAGGPGHDAASDDYRDEVQV